MHLGLERIVFGENPLGPHDQPLTFGREALKAVSAVDQGYVQLAFQLGDCSRERGLGHIAPFRRSREVPLLGNRDKVLQLSKEHPYPPRP